MIKKYTFKLYECFQESGVVMQAGKDLWDQCDIIAMFMNEFHHYKIKKDFNKKAGTLNEEAIVKSTIISSYKKIN